MVEQDLDKQKNMQKENFYKNLPDYMLHFEGCGNQLGVVPLTLAEYEGTEESWKTDGELRSVLAEWGRKINSDSVMVLFGDPKKEEEQGYDVKMFVFEPCGNDGSGLDGGISTMCGNGIRAVAAWLQELEPSKKRFDIMSMSGLRVVDEEDGLFTVRMGEFTNSEEDLSHYLDVSKIEADSRGHLLYTNIPNTILNKLSKLTAANTWSIGLNGTRDSSGKVDGEPHVVIEIPASEIENIQDLRKLAVKAGPIITKNKDLFPSEINVNFIVVKGINDEGKFEVWNCTHERNLGEDPNHSVTAACGTGSTVVGGTMLEKYLDEADKTILVKNTGGNLEINKDKDSVNGLLMKGPAQRAK